MKFVLVTPGTPVFIEDDGTPSTGGVFGGTVTDENAYIRIYGVFDGKMPIELRVGERTLGVYRLSGQRGEYEVVRVA